MAIMAIDHARDFVMGMEIDPTDLATTTPPLFFTRWITHFCAPVFVLLAGVSAYLYRTRHTASELSRFLLTRGLWLVLLELTVVRFGWLPDPTYRFSVLQVIWALGASMVLMAAITRLPVIAVGALGAAMIVLHDTLDGVQAQALGGASWLWTLLHSPGLLEPVQGHRLYVAYALVPWVGVMAAGYALGAVMTRPREERRRLLVWLGAGVSVGFVVLRGINVYGDPHPWEPQRDAITTLMAFLNCEKYPPSLAYLAMTLGPALLALAALEGVAEHRLARPLSVLGGVPLFFYVAHLYVLHYPTMGLALWLNPGGEHGFMGPNPALPLWGVYAIWAIGMLVLYPACAWFAGVKERRRDWWLSYL